MKFLKRVLRYLVIVIISLLLLEMAYKNDIIDFYKASWKFLNKNELKQEKSADLLVLGDSFSASKDGYVSYLREAFPQKVIYNASASGIGLNEINVFAKRRIQSVNPKAIIYQVYVGNDLIDLKPIRNFKANSIPRSLYWEASYYFSFLKYANWRLSGLRQNKAIESMPIDQDFSSKYYNERSKLYANLDPEYLSKSVLLIGEYMKKYDIWKQKLSKFLKNVPDNIPVYIVFIPHCAQVNDYYYENFEALGYAFNNNFKNDYPFFEQAKKDFSEVKNVRLLNPLPFLKKNDTEAHRLYFSNDPHFNNQGHSVLSMYIKDEIFR